MANIVETARNAGSFRTLVAAVQATGLTDTLNGPGPFTVFAPTDEAFDQLPSGALDKLLRDTSTLKTILTYHVAAGRYSAEDLDGLNEITTVQGSDLQIDSSGTATRIDNATVIQPVDNGIIHGIDAVLVPLAALQESNADYSYLVVE